MSEGSNYFIASSPRHVLLQASLALAQCRGRSNRLYLTEHIPAAGVGAYLDALAGWKSSPFEHVAYLEADWRPHVAALPNPWRVVAKRRLKWRFRADNRRRLDADLRSHPPQAIYVSCDNFYESQYLLHRASRANSLVRRIYVEDGTSAYEYTFRESPLRNRLKDLRRAVNYGLWWRPCSLPGASGWLEEGYLAFPELAHEKLKALRLHQLPADGLLVPEMLELARLLGLRFELDVERVRRAEVIVAVTNSRWSHLLPDYRQNMARICEHLLGAGKSLVLKQHPGDVVRSDPLGLGERQGIYVAPQALPFELLMMLAERDDATVVGDASTALLSTRWLRPGARVIALRHAPGGIDGTYLERVFRSIDVTVETELARVPEKYFSVARSP